ncbi:MAG: cell division ATP-binding protein FtsE [Deltaproteobacteria bacterium]
MNVIELTKVTKSYNKEHIALNDISLTIQKGEIVFLSGMSGAGKTTLIKLICGLEKPNRGIVEVSGIDLSKLNSGEMQQMRQRIGVAYQDFRLLPHLSVFENVAMSMEVAYKDRALIQRRVNNLLNMLLLHDESGTPVSKLSRGEQQRVAIARAAANAPPILLADEPTGNLDRTISLQVMTLFQQLNDAGSTILIATHDQDIYRDSPHRLLELKKGKLFTIKPGPHTS